MPDADSTKRKYTRLSDEEWASIRSEWESGSATLADLPNRSGASIRSLQLHFEKHGTQKGSVHRADLNAAARLAASAPSFGATDDTDPQAIKAATLRRVLDIEEAVAQQLAIVKADPASAFRAGSAVKALAAAIDVLSKGYALKRSVLDLDQQDAETRTVLVVRELIADDVERMRAEDEDADDDDLSPIDPDDEIIEELAA